MTQTSPSSLVTRFDTATLGAAVHVAAPALVGLPVGVDAAQLLWAFCGNESSFGQDCAPRHEPAYDVGGIYANDPEQAALLKAYGRAGACSYGPMQLLLVNAPVGTAPEDFSDATTALKLSVAALNKMIQRHKPRAIADIGSCWNAGHVIPAGSMPSGVAGYVAQLLRNYAHPAVPLPAKV